LRRSRSRTADFAAGQPEAGGRADGGDAAIKLPDAALPDLACRSRRRWRLRRRARVRSDLTGSGGGMDRAKATIGPGEARYGGGIYTSAAEFRTPPYICSDPEFSTSAAREVPGGLHRRLIVDSLGNPQRVHVVRALGWGWTKRQWKRCGSTNQAAVSRQETLRWK